ncbi:AbrB/MazE/SpoVT family DNA-binding domain-containing protein [Cytobacillus gottheilii]|uniref:AbrB/MazE/SpoVT family DNA-binding domain-containing protein n=1 Tax=Cytobacillus gottheilii TaxID=859144 RepID=UPI00249507FF|nr:AbrB/MazE/SpoVT family DNA-binding domain-containing protein [Cytobacillus gottheilii]
MYVRKITNSGQISIPKELYQVLDINDGDYLFINQEKNQLVIQSSHPDKSLNQCIFRRGKFTIPTELRKILNINNSTLLMIQAYPEESSLSIKPLNQHVESIDYYK